MQQLGLVGSTHLLGRVATEVKDVKEVAGAHVVLRDRHRLLEIEDTVPPTTRHKHHLAGPDYTLAHTSAADAAFRDLVELREPLDSVRSRLRFRQRDSPRRRTLTEKKESPPQRRRPTELRQAERRRAGT